jgi:serine protease Do
MKLGTFFATIALPAAIASNVGFLSAATPPKLNLQEAAISRQTKLATSFAPVAKSTSRSVVNIFTSRTFRRGIEPLVDDPVLRRFFGGPGFEFRDSRERRSRSLGSGVILSADGYILSNHHVTEDAEDIKVVLSDGREFAAKLVGSDAETDVAVLRIEVADLPAIAITDSDKLEVGDAVLAIGNPFGIGQTVTVGHVSGLGRVGVGIVDYEDFIQTDASINPGNSGGALVDAEGRLVGINTAIVSASGGNQGVGFAIPINLARSIMDQIVEHGKVTRGYLGVSIQALTPDLAREFKVPGASGALVTEVVRNSPADDAGLKESDVILEFNGRKVGDSRHFRLMVAQAAPGSSVSLKISRDGRAQVLTAKLGELRPGGMSRTNRFGWRRSDRTNDDLFTGVMVADLDSRTRREYDIPAGVRGALVMDVDPGSPAAESGLHSGDVIQEINREPVRDADEAIELSRRLTGGVLLRVWSHGGSRFVFLPAVRRR